MTEPSGYRVGPPPVPPTLSRAALGGVLAFVGFFLVIMGTSDCYAGMSTQNMFLGTITEGDAQSNRMFQNVIAGGRLQVAVGLLLVAFGVALRARRLDSPGAGGVVGDGVHRSFQLSQAKIGEPGEARRLKTLERVVAGIAVAAILFMLVFWILVTTSR